MKKLLLINPVGRRSGFLLSKFSTFPPLGLAYVAAVTPAGWDIKIIDENFDQFEFEEADLVGITGFTSNINRAYEIARTYRERDIKVVMGGIHVSMNTDEALQYADAVIVGEAEAIWESVINDYESGTLVQIYRGPQVDLCQFHVTPRRDLLHPSYFWHTIQTSRGCPFDCSFCSVSRHLGKEYRQRPTLDILKEIEDINGEYITFVDDNLIGYSKENRERAAELFTGMIRKNLRKKWWMQTSINSAEDERVIELAAQAGCMFVFIGFETINETILGEMQKGINLKTGINNYKKVIDKFHKFGIGVMGAFIIGNDYETPDYYKDMSDFLDRSGIDMVQVSILTPLPGTRLMGKLQAEDRLVFSNFPEDWDKYRFSYIVHSLKNLEPETVYAGNNYIKERLYSFPQYQFRLLKSMINLKNVTNYYAVYKMNQALKKSWQNSHYR